MPGEAFPVKPCCDRAMVTAGHEHTLTCPTRAAQTHDGAAAAFARLRRAARLDEAAAQAVPGPAPGVEGSVVVEGGVRVNGLRTPRWALHVFPTVWDSTDGHAHRWQPGAVDGRAVIPLAGRVVDVRSTPVLGVGLVVVCDSEDVDGEVVPYRGGGWQTVALRTVFLPGTWVGEGESWGPPELLGVHDGAPVFCTSRRPLVPGVEDVDAVRRAAGHEL